MSKGQHVMAVAMMHPECSPSPANAGQSTRTTNRFKSPFFELSL
jgi:hypothetical protein